MPLNWGRHMPQPVVGRGRVNTDPAAADPAPVERGCKRPHEARTPVAANHEGAPMSRYVVLESEWLEARIREAETLRDHAQSSGKPVAIAAASIRLESLKEIRRIAVPADGYEATE